MPLRKAKGNMYDWCTHTHSHLRGKCSHQCSYCYVQELEKRFQSGHWAGETRIDESELYVDYGKDKTIFIEHTHDLFAPDVRNEWLSAIFRHCRQYPDNTYVFQSKVPADFYWYWRAHLPPRCLLGTTIETSNINHINTYSCAPATGPGGRAWDLRHLADAFRVFLTIEPIMDFNLEEMVSLVRTAGPEFVNIGADSKNCGLPEPSADDVLALIRRLRKSGIEVRCKDNLKRITEGE